MVKGGKNLPGLTLSLPGMTLGEVDRSCTTDWSILDALKISRLLPRSIRRRPNGNRLPSSVVAKVGLSFLVILSSCTF
jgi:hypothetical protein